MSNGLFSSLASRIQYLQATGICVWGHHTGRGLSIQLYLVSVLTSRATNSWFLCSVPGVSPWGFYPCFLKMYVFLVLSGFCFRSRWISFLAHFSQKEKDPLRSLVLGQVFPWHIWAPLWSIVSWELEVLRRLFPCLPNSNEFLTTFYRVLQFWVGSLKAVVWLPQRGDRGGFRTSGEQGVILLRK